MATPSYTTDLTDITTIESGATFEEFTGYILGDNADIEIDWYLQGSACASDEANAKTGVGHSIGFDYGSNITFSTGDCFFGWMMCMAGNAMDTFVNGGYRVLIGSTISDFDGWKVGGNDFGRNPYGGWVNVVVDPTYTADYTTGTPTAYRHFGVAFNLTSAISKGRPNCADVYRYGRGEIIIEYGDVTNGYGSFSEIATQNDSQLNRWGLFQSEGVGYLWKGLMSFGNATNVCDFRDSNINITVDNTPRTYSDFNKIEINNSSSRVDWTGVNITALDSSQLSLGSFEMVANATVNFTSCIFTDMSTFIFNTNATVDSGIFRRCALVNSGGGTFNNTQVLLSTVAADSSAFKWDVVTDPDGYMDNMTFSKGTNAHHAIEFGISSPTTINLNGITSTGFNASNSQNDSFFYIARTSGTVTINVSGGTGNFSYKSAGAVVVIVEDPVTVEVHASTLDGSYVENALVFLKASDATGSFPFEETVTIVNSGTTATVTHTSHGMDSNDYVDIYGASLPANDGAFQITVTDADTYTYTMGSTPGSSPTGTITSTFIALYGLTDINGDKSTSRVYTLNQPVTGWVRKSSTSPYYVEGPINNIVDNVTGLSITVILISDE